MTTTIHKEAVVGPDGKIEISAPELTPGQKVQLILWPVPSEQDKQQGPHVIDIVKQIDAEREKRSAIDILNQMPGHRLFKTAEEVDAYIREERDSWDR